jgi:methyl-accepting chemotaxis protein
MKSAKTARVRGTRKVSVDASRLADLEGQVAAVGKSQAVIEFTLDGVILTANRNFLDALGYELQEIQGQHHRIFVATDYRETEEYRRFWAKLGRGEFDAGQYKRIAKGGREIWIQASYNPILDANGTPYKVVKYATDVTTQVIAAAEAKGQISAINRVQAVIEFALDGTVISANENFLKALGYTLDEVRGQHHRMFVDPTYRSSDDYRRFWEKLARGEFDAGQYKRLAKGGREIWIEASYNPIFNAEGKPYKVIKYATDVTPQIKAATETARIKSALDKASASVMLADDAFNIIYLNESAQRLFREAQADFRRDLPALDAEKVVGANIDIFHKNPAHQRQVLAKLQTTHTAEVRLGGRSMRISASPVLDTTGTRSGTVLEWWDRTQEVRSEEEVARIVQKALAGDLTDRLSPDGKSGFFATLARGLNELLENTAQMVRQIKVASTAVYRGAEEISQGNTNLSQRTEEQSSSLEETASSMEEMTSTVKQNADNAGQANQLATAARDQAEKGGTVVGKAVRAMTEINESSKKIADIISVIDEIAFQTNLLALNAAVEAARAGEQGRGFAVVATEVRSLAGRSATAAKEIKDLIQDSVRKVEDGSALVTQSGQTLEQIVASVKKVSDIVAEIAAASREQSSGIEQVNKAVMQMDEMTQQNAALVEQATAASQSMAEQAGELNTMMERYRLPGAEEDSRSQVRGAGSVAGAKASSASSAERRAAGRPWSAKPPVAKSSPRKSGEEAKPKAVGADSGADWQDF